MVEAYPKSCQTERMVEGAGLKLLGHYHYYESERELPLDAELLSSGNETRL